MLPSLLRISVTAAMPRLLMLLALFVLLLVAALGLLIREKRRVVAGAAGASVVLTALLLGRSDPQTSFVVQVSAFGASVCLSIALGCWWLLRQDRAAESQREATTIRICCALLGGIIGARLGFWLLLDVAPVAWRDLFDFRRGGLFGFGAYSGGLFVTFCLLRNDQQSFARWLDRLIIPLLLGTGLGRAGCYFDGCDFGKPLLAGAHPVLVALGTFPRWAPSSDGRYLGSPAWVNHVSHWGLSPDAPASFPVHPVQLYEAVFAFGLLLVAIGIKKHVRPAGILFLSVAATYSLGYFLLGFARGDATPMVMLVSNRLHWAIRLGSREQLVALTCCALALLIWPRWMHEQAFLTRFSPLFSAAKAKITHWRLVGRVR